MITGNEFKITGVLADVPKFTSEIRALASISTRTKRTKILTAIGR